jgi:Carboxypeptidase regulatory-like domain
MKTKLRYIAVLFAVALTLAWCVPAVGQVLKGSISGTVVDPQGAVVAGAQVQAKNVETGVVSTTTSDSSGLFRLNLLSAGTYNVEISAKGFKTTVAKGWVINAGVDTGMGNQKLTVGEASTTVEVTGAAPLIETTQAQITNTFSGTTLTQFAGVQENEGLDRLALFVPGVVATRSDNFSNTNGVGFSSNGLRGRNNDQEIDGQNNNDNSVGGPGLFVSDTEFVGQYVIVTNNFGPEYGRNAGSVVNILTKSGTNSWHGSVFGQDRSSFLDALTNTQRNSPKPGTIPPKPFTGPPRFNEEYSGGTIGGPIFKNKAFLFGGFDSDLFSGTTVYTTTALTPTPAGLSTLAGCPGINATALSVLNNFGPYSIGFGNPAPRPTHTTGGVPDGTFVTQTIGTCAGVQVGGVTRVAPSPFHGFDWVLKHDLQLGGDSLTARYLFNRGNTFGTGSSGTNAAAAGWINNVPALSQAVLASWTHNFTSRMVNEARVSFGRLNVVFGGGSATPLLPTAAGLANAFTNIAFQTGNGLTMGPATNIPQSRLVNTWQGQDNWNYVLGKHSFKAGVNWTYQRSPNTFLPAINGAYRFFSLSQFLAGCATCFNGGALGADVANRIQIAQGTPTLDFREYDTFLYAGDDWKIGQNLTLNLGLTWTYYGQPDNLFNQITVPREANPATAFWLQSLPASVTTDASIPAVLNSYAPSIGFAYSPKWGGFVTGHGKTTIRGGYRMLYDPPYYNIFLNQSTSAPMTFLQTITDGPTLTGHPLVAVPTGPNVRTSLAATIAPNKFDPRTQNETNITPNFGPDKVNTWSLGFEREVTKDAALEVRYVGNHGYNLFQTIDGNPYVGTAAKPGQLQAGLLPAGTPSCAATTQVGPGAGTDVGRLACGLGVVRTRTNTGFSDYHAVQTEFRANNMFKQLTLRVGYTFSKTLDNVSEIFATGSAGNTLFAAQNPFQPGGAERSTSGLSIPNAFTLIAVEQVPFFKEQHGLVGHILGGWTLSADYILASGQPYTPVQNFAEALSQSPFGNVYDSAWVGAFVGVDTARPFIGSMSAPINSVGVFAANACSATNAGCTAAEITALGPLAANQLVSLNALNQGSVVTVTNNQVRYIVNTGEAQTVFGTPFGNMPRNPARDARANLLNTTVYKNFKLGEKANFEMHLTLNNALNHFNFSSIVPNVEAAGVGQFGNDFANPAVTSTSLAQFGSRIVWVGGKISF